MANDGKLYQVSSVVGRKEVNGRTFYKVQWAGYSSDYDSWEPEANLSNCKSLVDSFLASKGKMVTRSGTAITPVTLLSSADETDGGSSTPRSRRKRRSVSRGRYRKSTDQSPKTVVSKIRKPPASTPRRKPQRHLTTRDLTPSRYYLRSSTITQRPPLHTSYISSDDEETTTAPTGPVQRLSRRDLHDEVAPPVSTKLSKPKPQAKPESPAWLNLGVAEMVLCLLILALVLASFWYLQYYLKVTSST